jgi:hypothetical protein
MSQCEIILQHLQSGKTLTKAQSWELYRIMNTGGRINELRNRGIDIKTTMTMNEGGNEYAIYWLAQKPDYTVIIETNNQLAISI